MELKVFFFFNVVADEGSDFKLDNQSSYFYEAINDQTKPIRQYAARKGITTRNQPPSINTSHQAENTETARSTLPITISDDDSDDFEESCNKPTSTNKLNRSKPGTTQTKYTNESTKRKTSQNQSVQTEDDNINHQNEVSKRMQTRQTKKKNRKA